MLKMFIASSSYLNAEQISENLYQIHLSNGEIISVEQNGEFSDGIEYNWRIDKQYFFNEEIALNYLKRLIGEKLTGKRIIYHKKKKVPEVCGVEGSACRCPGACNSSICMGCPVAEKFFAERDHVELVYAI